MIEYEAVEAPSVDALNEEIKRMIKDGWSPIGGVSVSLSESDDYQYFVAVQAMIRGGVSDKPNCCK
jgi:hypothetical protein